MWLPFGWKKYMSRGGDSVVGYTFRPSWPLFANQPVDIYLGYLRVCNVAIIDNRLVCTAAVLSLLHGYQITISENGINFAWTLRSSVQTHRSSVALKYSNHWRFGDPDDRLIIEASVSSEDVELLLTEKLSS